MNLTEFKKLYEQNIYSNIDMKLNLYQRFYLACLMKDKKVFNYIDIIDKFNTRFK